MDEMIISEEQDNPAGSEAITKINNIEKCLLDEICLEGLDGITVETLWIRLSTTLNVSCSSFTTKTKTVLWHIIQKQNGLEYYELLKCRPPLVIFNRYDYIDDELGMCEDPIEEPLDIYPYQCINDIKNGIVGSSTTYDTRVNVTEVVKSLTLLEVEKLYGSKLIIVANQSLRNNVLFQDKVTSDIELTPIQYCILERIGRSREHGEITQGKCSLNVIHDDPKNLFYCRKILLKHKLVTKQHHHQRINASRISGSLFHLSRFYNQMKTKTFLLIEQIVALLKTLPDHRMEYEEVRKYCPGLTIGCYKKLYKSPDFQRFIRTDVQRLYRELYPDAVETEWKHKGSGVEKKIRTMELIDPNVDVNAEWFAEEPEDDDEEEKIESDRTHTVLNKSLVNYMMMCVINSGANGLARNVMADSVGRTSLCTRALTRLLHKKNVCQTVMVDIGRQRLAKTCSRQFGAGLAAVAKQVQKKNCIEDEKSANFNTVVDVLYGIKAIEEGDFTVDGSSSSGTCSQSLSSTSSQSLLSTSSQSSSGTTSQSKSGTSSQSSSGTSSQSKSSTSSQSLLRTSSQSSSGTSSQSRSGTSSQSSLSTSSQSSSGTRSQSSSGTSSQSSMEVDNPSLQFHDNQIGSAYIKTGNVTAVTNDVIWNEENSDLDALYLEFQTVAMKLKLAEDEPWSVLENDNLIRNINSAEKRKCDEMDDATENDNVKVKKTKLRRKRKANRQGADDETAENNKKSKLGDALTDNQNEKKNCMEQLDVSQYKLEKYFGNNPKIYNVSTDMDKVKIKVIVSTATKEKHSDDKQKVVTHRKLSRANIIKDLVQREKIITDTTKVEKIICESESTEGYNVKIDRKSISRLIGQLITDGYLKALKIIMINGTSRKISTMLCDVSVELEHSIMQSALEQMKMKFLIASNNSARKPKTSDTPDDTNAEESKNNHSTESVSVEPVATKSFVYEYSRHVSREYGYAPKFVRSHITHSFLFYLVYEFPKYSTIEALKCGADLEPVLLKDLPPVYSGDEINWKTFIPPLPEHKGWPAGWALVSDIILRLPVTLFAQICHISYKIPGLKDFLNHPIKKYYLVKDLPPITMNGLLKKRKYIYHIHDNLVRLCWMGLLQFGPQKLKEKDQVFIFVNRRASLRNTLDSKPDYHQVENKPYPIIHKYLLSSEDVDNYWYDLWNISMGTKLGRKIILPDKYVIIEKPQFKPALMKCIEPVEQSEAEFNDNGIVPGDNLGAGGLDSALFTHIKRNWRWADNCAAPPANSKRKSHITGIRKTHLDNIQPKIMRLSKRPKSGKHIHELGRGSHAVRRNLTTQELSQYSLKIRLLPKMNKIIRKLVPRKDCKRRKVNYYDDKDKKSLLLMRKLRVDWSPTEDNVLLLCKLATMYLCPYPRKRIMPFPIHRDVLHTLSNCSANKTSKACQRRILYMLKNHQTVHSIQVCMDEIKRHIVIRENFESLRNKMLRNCDVSDDQLQSAFVYMMHFLITHFPRVQEPTELSVNRLQNDVEMYQSGHLKLTDTSRKQIDPKTEREIEFNVVRSTVHSALCSATNKTGWAYHFFKVYQKYSEELLRSVMTYVRKEQLIAIKRGYIKKVQESPMPLQTTPYQLSCVYLFALKGTINYDNLMQTYMFLARLKDNAKDPAETFEINRSNICTSIGLAELNVNDNHAFEIEIPMDILKLDPNVRENDLTYERILQKYAAIIASNPSVIEDDNGSNKDQATIHTKKSCNEFANTGRIAFYLQGQEFDELLDDQSSQHFHDYFVVNPAGICFNIKDTYLDAENNEQFPAEYSAVEPKRCEELLKLIQEEVCIQSTTNPEENLIEFLQENDGKVHDIEIIHTLINYIQSQGFAGATVFQLQETLNCEKLSIDELDVILKVLRKLRIIYRFGVVNCLYVHYEFCNPWVIDTFKLTRLEKEKIDLKKVLNPQNNTASALETFPHCKRQIYICPWINIDSTVNRRTLEIWLNAILNHCLINPGISMLNLARRFVYVTPFQVRLLTEYLEFLGCIRFSKLEKKKVTLFSKPGSFHKVAATGLEDSKELLIETEPSALLRLSIFIGYKGYREEFCLRRKPKGKKKN